MVFASRGGAHLICVVRRRQTRPPPPTWANVGTRAWTLGAEHGAAADHPLRVFGRRGLRSDTMRYDTGLEPHAHTPCARTFSHRVWRGRLSGLVRAPHHMVTIDACCSGGGHTDLLLSWIRCMHMQTMVRCFDGCPCNMMNSQYVSFVGKGKDHDGDDGRDDGKTWGGEHKGLVLFETAMVQHRGTRWGNGGNLMDLI